MCLRLYRDRQYYQNVRFVKSKKAHPARSESSLWQERRQQCQMVERFMRRHFTIVLWHSNPSFRGDCIVFLSTLRSLSIAMRHLRL